MNEVEGKRWSKNVGTGGTDINGLYPCRRGKNCYLKRWKRISMVDVKILYKRRRRVKCLMRAIEGSKEIQFVEKRKRDPLSPHILNCTPETSVYEDPDLGSDEKLSICWNQLNESETHGTEKEDFLL